MLDQLAAEPVDEFVAETGEELVVETKVCKEEVTLADFLVDFPTDQVEKCVEGVHCILEYLCE